MISNWNEEKEFWNNYYKLIADVVDKRNKYLKEELFCLTHYVQHCKLFDDVIVILEHIREKYRLAVISNAFPSMDWAFDLLAIRKYFDNIVMSAFVGASKPDEKIFKYALDIIMGTTPEESLFIDDREENIDAAEKLGMKTMHLIRPDKGLDALYLLLN